MAKDFTSIFRQSLESALAPILGRLDALEDNVEAGSTLPVDSSSARASAQVEGSVSNGHALALGHSPRSSVHALALGHSPLSDLQFSGQAGALGRPSSSTAHVTVLGRSPLPDLDSSERTVAPGHSFRSAQDLSDQATSEKERPVNSETVASIEKRSRRREVTSNRLSTSTLHVTAPGRSPLPDLDSSERALAPGHSLRSIIDLSDEEAPGKRTSGQQGNLRLRREMFQTNPHS